MKGKKTKDTIAEATYQITRGKFSHDFSKAQTDFAQQAVWDMVRGVGTKLWLDTGDIEVAKKLWCSQFEALTTNNTLLNKEVQKGIYDDLIADTASVIKKQHPGIDEKMLLLEISFVLNAHHGLKLAELFNAHVSVELHTDLGNDVENSVEYGKRYYEVCPERFYVKVPFTAAGLVATRKLSELGVPVNFTLGFSARQNYVAALFSQPGYVNVFMGRLNAFVANNSLGDGANMGEKATLATQRQLLELRKAKRTETMLIGASMREGSQVISLAGLDVYTMPPKVAAEYQENPEDNVVSQIENDPSVSTTAGVSLDDFNALSLWEVSDEFKLCVDELLKMDSEHLTADDIQGHFADAGFGDFLPYWSDEDIETITADGKIPVYKKWTSRLKNGEIGLDALMNVSAFYSFATDQGKLDSRIKSLL